MHELARFPIRNGDQYRIIIMPVGYAPIERNNDQHIERNNEQKQWGGNGMGRQWVAMGGNGRQWAAMGRAMATQ